MFTARRRRVGTGYKAARATKSLMTARSAAKGATVGRLQVETGIDRGSG
jgi:hypothetical protein